MNCVPPSQILPFGHLTSGRPLICGTRRHCQQPWKAARPSASPLSQQHSAPGNVERAEGSRDEPNNNRFMIDYQSTRRIWSTWHRLDDDSFAVLASLSAVQHSNTKGSAGPHDDPMPCSGENRNDCSWQAGSGAQRPFTSAAIIADRMLCPTLSCGNIPEQPVTRQVLASFAEFLLVGPVLTLLPGGVDFLDQGSW